MWRISGTLLLGMALLMIVGTGRPARAQDEDEPEEEQPAQPRRALVIIDEQFERWVFRGFGGAGEAREYLENLLVSEIERIDLLYKLTPRQKKKLEVAGRGDLKRLFDRIEEMREVIHRAWGDANRVSSILMRFQPLRNPRADLFGDGSLFAKTLKWTLTPEQRARREEKELLAAYRTRVEWTVSSLDQRVGLGPEQHERFVSLIAQETRPLKRYGELDEAAVLLQASRLPEDKLRPIFNEAQWRLLRERFDRARQLERVLLTEGYLPEKEPARTWPAVLQAGAKQKQARRD